MPIIGTELYQAYEHRTERPVRRNSQVDDSGGEVEGGRKAYYHLTALAESSTGYRNLIQLSSRAYLEGYYQKPKVDWEILADHHEGVIATTGCLGGHVLQALLNGRRARRARGRRHACRTSSAATTSSSSCRTTGLPEQAPHEPAADGDRPCAPGAAARHERQPLHPSGDAEAHDALLCVQTNAKIHEENRFRFSRRPALPEDARSRCAASSTRCPRRATTRCGSPSVPNVELEFGQPGPAELPGAGGSHRGELPARAHLRGRGGALRRDARTARARAHRVRARRHRVDGLLRVLPRRVGHRAVREVARASASDPGGGARPARASRTACASSTSTRSATTCCSSGS